MGSKKKTPAKRRRRFGTILSRRRPDGTVVYRARWSEGRTGKRRERLFNSEKEAKSFLKGIQRQMLLGEYRTPPTVAELTRGDVEKQKALPTLIEYATQLLQNRLAANLAESTLGVYEASLSALTAFYGRREANGGVRQPVPLDLVTAASFLDYRAFRRSHRRTRSADNDVKARPVSAATVNRDQQFLSVVLNQAVLDGHIERNPIAKLKKLKEPRKRRRWLPKAQVRALFTAADNQFRPFLVAMAYTGCRPVELRSLTWADVKLEEGKLSIYRVKVGNSDELDIHPRLERVLRRLKAEHGEAARPDAHVFLNRYGRPWKDMRRAWARTVKAAGLDGHEGLTLYSLRHTFATHFLDTAGVSKDLQSQLGHSDLETTERYAGTVSARRREAVLRMDFGEDDDDLFGVAEAGRSWTLTPAR